MMVKPRSKTRGKPACPKKLLESEAFASETHGAKSESQSSFFNAFQLNLPAEKQSILRQTSITEMFGASNLLIC